MTEFVFRELRRGGGGGRTKAPTVSIQRSGIISLNRAAFALLGEPQFVVILVDADKKAFAFQKATKKEQNAYPIRMLSRGSAHAVSGRRLLGELGLELGVFVGRFSPRKEGELLIIEMAAHEADSGSS
jgi:hypothetical protein